MSYIQYSVLIRLNILYIRTGAVLKRVLRWFGHVDGIDDERIYDSVMDGRRARGRSYRVGIGRLKKL